MKLKWLPYVIILLFTTIVSIVRYYLIPEWSLGIHGLVFCIQFVILSCIWRLVDWLSNSLDRYIPFSQQVGKRIVVQLLLSLVIIAPVFFTVMYFARKILPPYATPQFLTLLAIIFVIFIALINFISYFKYFFLKWENSVLSNAQLTVTAAELEKEKSMMRFHHLKNQVNPHFLFNTFTSLDGLVQSNPDLASEFIRHLSKVYRYVLEHKENEIVSIETEINFIRHYISLLNIRYKEAITIRVDISKAAQEKGIVMVTLQMLIDNAIKHNIVQPNMPLRIEIWDEDDYLHIHNNRQLRKQIETSNKQGLKQLQELYAYLTDKPVKINETESAFEINLPLL